MKETEAKNFCHLFSISKCIPEFDLAKHSVKQGIKPEGYPLVFLHVGSESP